MRIRLISLQQLIERLFYIKVGYGNHCDSKVLTFVIFNFCSQRNRPLKTVEVKYSLDQFLNNKKLRFELF